jgi:hypothetical protein
MRVLIACEYSGRTRQAFAARGHHVISCDLLPAEDNSLDHVVGDVFDVIRDYGPFDLMIAHPPCTYLANSGVRWLRDDSVAGGFNVQRYVQMIAAGQFFADLLMANIPRIAVENPIMHQHGRDVINANLSRYSNVAVSGPHYVQPWWFGDEAFKATGFTLKGLQPLVKPADALVPPKPGTPEHKAWSVIHNASPGPNRWKDRSRTFPGIARAMAEQWG